MKKTKAEIMKEISEYANGEEITPSYIRKYLSEKYGLSRVSIYRFFKKADEDVISITLKNYEQKDSIDYTDEEFEEITMRAFEILHSNNKTSLSTITIEEVIDIAERVGTTPRFLCCNILGINTKVFDKLMKGQLKTSQIILGLGYKDDEMSEKVKKLRHSLIQDSIGKKFDLEQIEKIAEETEIPIEIVLKKVFDLSQAQITRLYNGANIVFSCRREFIDYKYNDTQRFEDIYRKRNIGELNDELINEHTVIDEEDKKDHLNENEEFYNIDAKTQQEFIEELNKKRRILKLRRTALTEKYNEKYDELLRLFKEQNFDLSNNSIGSNELFNFYISQLKEIISRNPKYYKYYPPKLMINDFKEIAKDFGIDEKLLAYKMFHETHYNRREENNESYFRITHEKLPYANKFYELFHKEIDQKIIAIVNNTIKDYKGKIGDVSEDIIQMLRIEIVEKGTQLLFYGEEAETKEEYFAKLFGYIKLSCRGLCDREMEKQRNTSSLNDRLKDDSDTEVGEMIADKPHAYTDPILYTEGQEEPEEPDELIGKVLAMLDENDARLIGELYTMINETGNREKALEQLATKMNIPVINLKRKIDEIYERLN